MTSRNLGDLIRSARDQVESVRENKFPHIRGFRAIDVLGRGGMGLVYRATQEAPRRLVALKVLTSTWTARDRLARFRNEAESLARLQHEGIARIFASGVTDHPVSQPYIVMELVDGARSLTVFADQEKLTVAGRLELIARIAEALQHAHNKAVIHRDLKPANILVDRHGQPKVVDFGVAKILDPENGLSLATRDHHLVGTLDYMSPEQVEGSGAEVDARTDLYALGLVAYELLSGELPYSVRDASISVACKTIAETETRPLHRIVPHVDRDVETVIMKALRKRPEDRYPTIASFAEDVRRIQRNEPIAARPPSALYMARKFCRRHRTLVGVTGFFLAMLVFALGIISWLFLQSEELRLQADRERERVFWLADLRRLDELRDDADQLWPLVPDMIPEFEAWIDRADAFLAKREERGSSLARLRAERGTYDSERDSWTFRTYEATWFHDNLARLIERLDELHDGGEGSLSDVQARLEWAAQVEERSVIEPEERWDEAIDAIASSPIYEELWIEPVLGFVPIGEDEQSGLWEFAHLQSGTVAERGPEGAIVMKPENGLVFVLVPGGRFTMGARQQPGAGDTPLHEVELDPFLISKYEMTQEQWQRITGTNPAMFRYPAHPVESIHWLDAKEILHRYDLVLTTEAQWEYAARAGTDTLWFFGDTLERAEHYGNVQDASRAREWGVPLRECETYDDGFSGLAPVGAFLPNAFGLHDVHGNVLELCLDGHNSYAKSKPDPGTGYRSDGQAVVARGGSYGSRLAQTRCSSRYAIMKNAKGATLGVRPARALDSFDK